VCEHRTHGERKFHLGSHLAGTSLEHLAASIKARQSFEQAHQQLNEELGLDYHARVAVGAACATTYPCAKRRWCACNPSGSGERRRGRRSHIMPPSPPSRPTLAELRRRIVGALLSHLVQ
jgi:hypothetical protein